MADFYQTGTVTTLHRLKSNGLDRLEAELERFSTSNPIGLVLPALYSEFETPAMTRIKEHLSKVNYLSHIVLVLARADAHQYEKAIRFFDRFPNQVTFIWIDGERVQSLLRLLAENGVPAGEDGKGRSCWLAFGYLLATQDCSVIALHDCDILSYDRDLLARLCYPVANPNLGFEFCKGYYARTTNVFHGRVTRLFVAPLVRAMQSLAPNVPFLGFLDSFRYPLAGEFAMRASLARVNRIPGDWGLEVGILADVFRNCALSRICQVDLAENYEHKHQPVSADDATKGLRRMTSDIAKSLFRTVASEGIVFSQDHFRALEVRYLRMAQDMIARHYADALLNGIKLDRHSEEMSVAAFSQSLREAAKDFIAEPLGLPMIPNWNRVLAAVPEFFERLLDAVQKDNRESPVPVGTRR
jgi:glucosyl-3-phosphoglycerate synthase